MLSNLRKEASNILHCNKDTDLNKTQLTQLLEELYTHQIELDIQNRHLRETQAELQKLCKKYFDLYHFAPFGYFTINNQGLIVEANNTAQNMLGIAQDKLINRLFSRYMAPDSQYSFSTYRINAFNHIAQSPLEIKLLSRDDRLIPVRLDSKMLKSKQKNNPLLLCILTDLTHANKMESNTREYALHHHDPITRARDKGLSAAVAHELNHPLAVIGNYVHGCIRRLESGDLNNDTLIQVLNQVSQQLMRASDIMLHTKNFYYKNKLHFKKTCINQMIQESIDLIKQECQDSTVAIHFKAHKFISEMVVDKLHIQQVILNLARNAIESMKDTETAEPKLIIEINQFSKNDVEISINDNGPGYCPDDAHRLFEPYFTTKPYGIGLGLTICRKIIESHGGKIYTELNYPYGACFKFTLPLNLDKK